MNQRDLTCREVMQHLRAIASAQPSAKNAAQETFYLRLQALRALVEKQESHTFPLTEIYQAIFPNLSTESRRVKWSGFRSDLSTEAEKLGHRFTIVQPDGRGQSVNHIHVHFQGIPLPDDKEKITTDDSARLDSVGHAAPRSNPDVIRIFISFSMQDREAVVELKKMLEKTWGENRSHKVDYWIFTDLHNGGIAGGEKNLTSIQQAIANCPIALYMLTPDFSASEFIKKYELPPFLDGTSDKHPVFINVRNSAYNARHLSKEIKERFIIPLERGSFEDQQTKGDKEKFAMEVNDHIEELCKRHFTAFLEPHHESTQNEAIKNRAKHMLDVSEVKDDDVHCVPGHFQGSHHSEKQKNTDDSQSGVDAVQDLVAWAQSSERASYFGLLGEVGSGKTTTCLMFARALNQASLPIRAYYFDLRYVNYDGLLERTQKRPTLEQILQAIIARKNIADVCANDYIKAVREEKAILIFDGLDEIFVSLSDAEQDAFMQQLLMVLPLKNCTDEGAGKLLLACRTHYFRSAEAERGGLTLQGREGLHVENKKRAAFEIARMLPFAEEQIQAYFAANLPAVPFDELWQTLAEIHNLQELATQPYLLNLIRLQLPRINAMVEKNQSVNTADLYQGFIEDWSHERNRFHNVISADDKTTLMERLAAHLWQNDTKTFPAKEMETWLRKELIAHPEWRVVYADLLKPQQQEALFSDFRTASFVTRWDGDAFRFAHTSLQEYFLACHLVKGLQGNDAAAVWDLPRPSDETFDFVGQLLEKLSVRDLQKALEGMKKMLGSAEFPENARRNVFLYHLRIWNASSRQGRISEPSGGVDERKGKNGRFQGNATRHQPDVSEKRPCLVRPDLCLRGMDWGGLKIIGTEENPIHLGKVDFSHSFLGDSTFEYMHFADGADFTNTGNGYVKMICCTLRQADFTGTKLLKVFLQRCDYAGVIAPPNLIWDYQLPNQKIPSRISAMIAAGHSYAVTSAAYSPDGKRIISASSDNTLKLWDAATGACLHTFTGHSNTVHSVAYSPDGKRIISASDDDTLKMWDAATGECLHTFTGHSSWVRSAAFSPDGKRIISASDDNTLKLWDAASGECLHTITGHSDWVLSAAFSPDAKRIISASDDMTLKLWDAISGECLHTFHGHSSLVRSGAFSPDGKRIISASDDETLKLWDAATGTCLHTFTGHSNIVNSAAYSPDGKRIISASDDNTLKLWDVASGECLHTFTGYSEWINSVAFSPDGKRIISASSGTLELWDAASGECLHTFTGHSNFVTSAAFSPDGKWIVSRDFLGNQLCHISENGQQVAVPAEAKAWLEKNSIIASNSTIRMKDGKKMFFVGENKSAIILEPWDAAEAKKPEHEIRWKIKSGPKDYWRYVQTIDRETGEVYDADYALAEDFQIVE